MTEIENLRQVVRDAFSHELVSILVEGHDIMRAIDAVEAATLERGTCKRFWTGSEMICSECAHQLNDPTANFCPNCGRRVVAP